MEEEVLLKLGTARALPTSSECDLNASVLKSGGLDGIHI